MNSRNAQLSKIKATNALAGITQYGYDGPRPVASLRGGLGPGLPGGVDHLVSVSDPRTLVTSYAVDGLDNQKQLVSPDTGTAEFNSRRTFFSSESEWVAQRSVFSVAAGSITATNVARTRANARRKFKTKEFMGCFSDSMVKSWSF